MPAPVHSSDDSQGDPFVDLCEVDVDTHAPSDDLIMYDVAGGHEHDVIDDIRMSSDSD